MRSRNQCRTVLCLSLLLRGEFPSRMGRANLVVLGRESNESLKRELDFFPGSNLCLLLKDFFPD